MESLVLAIGGAALGVFIAWDGLKLVVVAMPPDLIPSESAIRLNTTVMAFTLVLAAVALLLFGLVPALQTARRDRHTGMLDSGETSSSGRSNGGAAL